MHQTEHALTVLIVKHATHLATSCLLAAIANVTRTAVGTKHLQLASNLALLSIRHKLHVQLMAIACGMRLLENANNTSQDATKLIADPMPTALGVEVLAQHLVFRSIPQEQVALLIRTACGTKQHKLARHHAINSNQLHAHKRSTCASTTQQLKNAS